MGKKKKQRFLPQIIKTERPYIVRIFNTEFEKKSNEVLDENTKLKKEVIGPIEDFLREIKKTKSLVLHLTKYSKNKLTKHTDLIDEIIAKNTEKDTKEILTLRLSKVDKESFDRNFYYASLLNSAEEKVLESFLTYMITLYENFLSDQIKIIYERYPNKLDNNKKIDYSEFIKFKSIEEIQHFYIESSIRSIVGGGTHEQIKKIDGLIDQDGFLFNTLPIVNLVEISSRRNLYVHSRGVVNEQYINNCKKVGLQNIPELGEHLKITTEYFDSFFDIIFESTIIMFYVIAYKCFNKAEEIKEIDHFFNTKCVDLLRFYLLSKKWDKEEINRLNLAIKLLEFIIEYSNRTKNHEELTKLYFKINYALCYKIIGDKDKCNKILNKHDWSATNVLMKFAYSILMEDWERAIKLMPLVCIGENETVDKDNEEKVFGIKDFQNLPLFFELRERDDFKQKYREVFGQEFGDDEDKI